MSNYSGAVTKSGYYLTTGEGNKMYVLRYNWEQTWWIGDRSGQNHRDYHVRNLSIDYDKAVAKAKEYVARCNKNSDTQETLTINNQTSLDKIVQRDKEVIAAEKAKKAAWEALKAKWAEEALERRARKNNNFVYACWANYMARSCKSFDTLQNGQLDTENRITMTGTIKTIKEYENNFSYYESYVYKSVIELDTGHRVFGSVPTYKCSKRNCKIRLQEGERVTFDAKLEKPEDFDGTFYYYKRPTKVQPLDIREVA